MNNNYSRLMGRSGMRFASLLFCLSFITSHALATVSLTIYNDGCQSIEVYWDNNGAESHYGTIQPNNSWNVTTYSGHEWIYRSLSGSFLGGYTVMAGSYNQDDHFNSGGCGNGDCSSVSNNINGFIYMGEHNGSKYFCSDDNNNDWAAAVSEASNHGGYLVVINDASENAFLKANIIADYAWIGYTDEDHEDDFDWVNEESDNYTNWYPGEPNDGSPNGGNADYTVIEKASGQWFDRNGGDHYEYVMEIPCSTTPPGGDCNTEIAYWDLENCYSNSGDNSGNDYSEMTPEVATPGSCGGSFSASVAYRDNGSHSCTPGYDGNVAMCVGTRTNCDFIDNDEYALRFDVTVKPAANGTASLSGLSFYEKAPTHYDWIGGSSGPNNYPTKYGIRVTVNGQEVYKETNISTTQNWTMESFDFTSDNDFTVTANTTFSFELRAYCRVGNGASNAVWDIDEIKTYGCCEGPCALSGGDSDGDGVCDNDDCAPNNADLPAAPGTACNDGDVNTINDVIQGDGCSCAGTFDSCVANGGDSDGDGTCDNQDCQPNNPDFPATPGSSCDDGDPSTTADAVTADGCGCAGTPVNVCDNVILGGTIGFGGSCEASTNVCNTDVPTISNCSSPSGGNGSFEVIWLKAVNNPNCVPPSTTVDNIDDDPYWSLVPGASGLSLDPGSITGKTCYLRCVRRAGCTTYIESNIIMADIDPNCGGGGGDPDCENGIEIVAGNGTITVSGLDGAPISSLQIFTSDWSQTITNCFANCSSTEVISVPAGSYLIYAKYYTIGYALICEKQASLTVGGGSGGGPCDNNGGDTDGDGTCDDQDCQPTNPDFPATPGTSCNDGNPNTTGDTVTSDGCGCAGTPIGGGGDPDCEADIQISTGNGTITVTGLGEAPVSSLQIFTSDWTQSIISCFADCSSTETVDVPAGDYLIYAKYYTAGYSLVCEKQATVTVGGGTGGDPCDNEGGDTDGDGTCDNQDCQPNNPDFPATPGTSCDDGNANTTGDAVTSDGCGCAGTPINTGCTPTELVTYNMDACVSCTDGTNEDWSELTAATISNGGCGGVTATSIDPVGAGDTHSCTPGASGNSMCIGQGTSLEFSVTLNGSGVNRLTGISFYEQAPTHYLWETAGCSVVSGDNNPPTDFTLRVYKNGNQVFSTVMNTQSSWNQRTVDFTNDADFEMSGSGTYRFVFTPRNAAGSGSVKAWDLDEVKIFGCCEGNTDPCAANGGDSDGDGTCDNQDCQPTNPDFPATPGSSCNDGNANTTGDVVTSDGCGCAGTPIGGGGDPDCENDIEISTGNGTITVSGLDGSPVSSLQIFTSDWSQTIINCFADCGATETFNVSAGSYLVYAKYYTAAYSLICEKQATVTVGGGPGGDPCDNNGGDTDGDGTCDNQDCQPTNPDFPATPGASCDDGNANTTGDVVGADGCSCAGTAVGPDLCVDRTAGDSKTSCGSGTNYGFYANGLINGLSNNARYTISNASFKEYDDGTATYTARATNNDNSNVKFDIAINLAGRTSTAPAGSPKSTNCYSINTADWNYYTSLSGTLTGLHGVEGGVLNVDLENNIALQTGTGANLNDENEFGASSWLSYTVVSQPTASGVHFNNGVQMDINIRLSGDGNDPCSSGGGNNGGGATDCGDITIANSPGMITVGGLDGAPVTSVQIFSADYTQVFFTCFGDCNPTENVSVSAGSYIVLAKNYNSSWMPECEASQTINVVDALLANDQFDFEVVKQEEHAEVLWVHNQGDLMESYTVERSLDGQNFELMVDHTSKGGSQVEVYHAFDFEPAIGDNFYRIRMNRLDGTSSYSNTLQVHYADVVDFVLFPNPANDFTKVNLETVVGKENVTLTIYNNLGIALKQFEIAEVYGKFYQLDLRELKEGHYIVWMNIPGHKPVAKQLVVGKL